MNAKRTAFAHKAVSIDKDRIFVPARNVSVSKPTTKHA